MQADYLVQRVPSRLHKGSLERGFASTPHPIQRIRLVRHWPIYSKAAPNAKPPSALIRITPKCHTKI